MEKLTRNMDVSGEAMRFGTLAEVSEHAIAHLLGMQRRSVTREGRCAYRLPNGERCVAGAFIPDDLYEEMMEDMPFHEVVNCHQELIELFQPGILMSALDMICGFQRIHDDPGNWGENGLAKGARHDLDGLRRQSATAVPRNQERVKAGAGGANSVAGSTELNDKW